MRVAALGRTHWLYEAVRLCVERGHDVVLVGTCPAAPEYRVDQTDFEALAGELGCAFFCDSQIEDQADAVERAAPDLAISVNWCTTLARTMLERFPLGVLNAHLGALPRFRGNAAPNWAILAGEERVVLTVHLMDEELDAGPVLLQREVALGPDTLIGDVYHAFDRILPGALVEAAEGLHAGTVRAVPQPSDPASTLRAYPRLPRDGAIDWSRPAWELHRLVRASAEPFAGAYSYLNGERVTVWRAVVETPAHPLLGTPGQVADRRPSGDVVVITGEGLLVLQEVETATLGRVPAAAAVHSTRARLGLDVEEELDDLRRRVAHLEQRLAEADEKRPEP